MKILAVVSFIFNPLIFVASVFTIPAVNVPLISYSWGWSAIFIIMIGLAAATWWYFKKKGWI